VQSSAVHRRRSDGSRGPRRLRSSRDGYGSIELSDLRQRVRQHGCPRNCRLPLRSQLSRYPFLGGNTPNYADYIALGAFHWVASISTLPLLARSDDTLRRWLDKGFDLRHSWRPIHRLTLCRYAR
jgi:glutathione S-transferase